MRNLIVLVLFFYGANTFKLVWDDTVDIDEIDLNDIDGMSRSDVRMPNWFLIFPGTKWCGAGDIAANDTDFGPERDTDKCCRNHDKCPDIIEGFETKNNLTNPSFYTRLNCECDDEFYKCLKSVSTRTAKQVGQLYFTFLGTQCYKEEHPIKGCNKYTYIPKRKCVDYSLDLTKNKLFQWFDVKNF